MDTQPIPLNLNEQRATERLPCDSVPRYKVGPKADLTYSQAYDAICEATGATKNTRGGLTFRRDTVKRLAILNQSQRLHIKHAAARLDAELQQKP